MKHKNVYKVEMIRSCMNLLSFKKPNYRNVYASPQEIYKSQLRQSYKKIKVDLTIDKAPFYEFLSAWRSLSIHARPDWKDKHYLGRVFIRIYDIVKRDGITSLKYNTDHPLPYCSDQVDLFIEFKNEVDLATL